MYDIVTQHIEAIVEENKAQKVQIRHYQEKCDELTLEMEKQRQILHFKTQDMEKQLELSQKQFIDQQDEAQQTFMLKEQDFEKQISQLNTELEKANQEIQLRERQIRKHDQRIEDEIQKQKNLQLAIDGMLDEQRRLRDNHEAVKDTYDHLESKLNET